MTPNASSFPARKSATSCSSDRRRSTGPESPSPGRVSVAEARTAEASMFMSVTHPADNRQRAERAGEWSEHEASGGHASAQEGQQPGRVGADDARVRAPG